MKFLIVLVCMFILKGSALGQIDAEDSLGIEYSVPVHKDQLKMTLIIDSIVIGDMGRKANFRTTMDIRFDSDYLEIADGYYIRIFVSRNEEFGQKFYAWKWKYIKRNGRKYTRLGQGIYVPILYNQPFSEIGALGQGVGIEGDPDYFMIYYRYKIE